MWRCIWVGIAVSWLASGRAAAGGALDKPPFTAAPAELLALAKAARGDAPAIVLRQDVDVRYDDQGRATIRRRMVVAIRAKAAIDRWAVAHASWRAFYQDRPVVRARVVEPSGVVEELDASAVVVRPNRRSWRGVSDLQLLEIGLPTLQIGAVAEWETVTTDREPILSGGSVTSVSLGNVGAPTSSTVIACSAPTSSRIRRHEYKLPAGIHARRRTANGRESWTYELGPLPARSLPERFSPKEAQGTARVGFATAASWTAVARAYRALVDQQIAEGPVTLPAGLPRTATVETVGAITAWQREHLRYTGLEFVDTHYRPDPPAETLKRGHGANKDLSTLLVALLRAAGLRAELVLADTVPFHDLDAELPGIDRLDHALVRVRLDAGEVWVDPTDDWVRPGQLPTLLQGRKVLVIADDTQGLSTTPSAPSADNTLRRVVTFAAAESGPAQLTEVTHATGAVEEYTRRALQERSDSMKRLAKVNAEAAYGATFDDFATSDPEDLTRPLEVTVTAKGASAVFTSRDQIDVRLRPGWALQEVPPVIREPSAQPRSNDFVWYPPHVFEIVNRIVVPPGFDAKTDAFERTRPIGSATLTESRRVEGNAVVVSFRLDTGKPRLTPAELAALQTAVRDLEKEEVHLTLENTALALARAGKLREAVAAGQRLVALHPREALHHDQLATVLLDVGAGAAARREAQAAVALAPGEADTQLMLGWVLTRDTLGRPYGHDWDRAGAIAALRKARTLDVNHLGAADTLAEALERNAAGRRFEPGADVAGAIEARRAALALERSDRRALSLGYALLHAGDAAETESIARATPASEWRDTMLIVAVAARAGARAALQVAGELRKDASRNTMIDRAAWDLALLHRYDLARALYAETGSLKSRPQFAADLAELTAQSSVASGTADPAAAVRDVLLMLVDPARTSPVFWDAASEAAFRTTMVGYVPPGLREQGTPRFLSDWVLSVTKATVEGDAGAWRVRIERSGRGTSLYFVLDRGIAKLLGSQTLPSGVGRYVLRAAGTADEPRARRLLDWMRADLDASRTDAAALQTLWGPGAPSSHDAITLAGAAVARDSEPDRVIAIATRCPSTEPDAAVVCHELLLDGYRARGSWPDVVTQIEAIEAVRPERAARLVALHAGALARSGRLDDAERVIDRVLARQPGDLEATIAKLWAPLIAGPLARALPRLDAVVAHPQITPQALNAVAWQLLGRGGDLKLAEELARKAVAGLKNQAASASVNTLAALEAEIGELDGALKDNWKAMELRGAREPSDDDWYVAGRIDEQLGLAADATAIYKRIPAPKGNDVSAYSLAQTRLAAIARAAGH